MSGEEEGREKVSVNNGKVNAWTKNVSYTFVIIVRREQNPTLCQWTSYKIKLIP